MTRPGGRHRAPEPEPVTVPAVSKPYTWWVRGLLLAIVVGLIVGALGSTAGWGTALAAFLLLLITYSASKPAKPHPRAKREVAYAARTAERAGIWWTVFRVLNSTFGGGR